MENIDHKLVEIKSNYFKNIFNHEYIKDSFEFLDSINFFSSDEKNNKFSIFAKELSKYNQDFIFHQIKEIFLFNKSLIEKANHKKESSKPKYSVYKLKNLYAEKLKIGMSQLIKSDQEFITDSRPEESKENKYASLVEKLFKKKQDDDQKEKEFQEKCKNILNLYEREKLFEFLKEIKVDPKIAEKIFAEKNEHIKNFKDLSEFENEIMNYFLSNVYNKHDFTKINNKEFELFYKIEKHNNSLTLLFEKEMNINVIHLLSLIYEVEFYPKWFPFCSHSNCISQQGKAKKVVHMVSNFPVISDRDFLVYGFGVNRLKENNSILLLVRSILEDNKVFHDYFLKRQNKKYVRAEIAIFGFEINIINKNRVLLKGLANTDPKIDFLPQWLINKVSQQFATDLFSKMVQITKNFEGSEYQNKNPSKLDRLYYDFMDEEIKNTILEDGTINITPQNI